MIIGGSLGGAAIVGLFVAILLHKYVVKKRLLILNI